MKTQSIVNMTLPLIYLIMSLFCSLSFAQTVNRTTMLSNSCAACHGTDGKSVGSIPSIAGKSVDYFIETMHAFRDGSRPSTVMMRHATAYSDDDIKRLADYFSKQ